MVLIIALHHIWSGITSATSVLHRLADPPALSPHLEALGCHTSSHHSQPTLNSSEAKSMVQKRCWGTASQQCQPDFPALSLLAWRQTGKGKKQFHLQVQVTCSASSLQRATEPNRNVWRPGPQPALLPVHWWGMELLVCQVSLAVRAKKILLT